MAKVEEGAERDIPSRPKKEAASEIFALSILALLIVFGVPLALGREKALVTIWELSPDLGNVVLEHIGWGFGVYIPALLGFYAIVIGGQITASPAGEVRNRRALGIVAEVITAALAPALVLVFAAGAKDPVQLGALFIAVPATAVTFYLAVQLGGFVVLERERRLELAKESKDWAQERLKDLQHRSRRPLWIVVTANTLVGSMLGLAVFLLGGLSKNYLVAYLIYFLTALGLSLLNMFGIDMLRTARDVFSKIIAWLVLGGVYLAVVMLVLYVFVFVAPAAGVGMLSTAVFIIASTFLPRHGGPSRVMDWTLRGAAIRQAAKSVVGVYRRSARKIQELTPNPGAHETPTFRDRLIAALQAFKEH